MEPKQTALQILLRDPITNIDMTESLIRDTADVLFAENGTVLLRSKDGRLYKFASDDEADGRRALAPYHDITLCVAHGEKAYELLKSECGLITETACRQFAHTAETVPPVDTRFTYRVLTMDDVDFVREHYKHDHAYVDRAVKEGRVFGAEYEGKLAGFIGMHSEGSVGMLEVDPAYRRMGLGTALENYMFRMHRERGWTAYGQVYVDNEGSLALQKSMGIEASRELIRWMFPPADEYLEFGSERLEEIKALYEDSGWKAYLTDDEKLKRAFDNSLYTYGAAADGRLIGFVRCVGDGEHVVLVQDLIVRSDSRRLGIGNRLMRAVMEKYKDVRMLFIVTDKADEKANAFYRALGMKPIENGGMISYFRC